MQALNTFFKELAAKLSLPDFFKGTSLIFNNLFLSLVAAVSFIGLLLIIFLVPGKKKTA